MTSQLPPFDDIDLALEDAGAALGAAAVHGLLTGLACAGQALPPARLRPLLDAELDTGVDDALYAALAGIDRTLRAQLASDELGFEILLPEDDVSLAARVTAMAQWCDAFLAGFGTGTGGRDDRDFPEDVRLLLSTIADFTRAEVGDEEDEDAERDFMELVEYLRIAALTLFLEVGRPRDDDHPPLGVLH